MRIALIHISDMHCQGHTPDTLMPRIDRAISAIKSLGSFDGALLACSGDLTDHAYPNEFKTAKRVLGCFLSRLGKVTNSFVQTAIVPGNHDIWLTSESRKIDDILKWNKEEHLDEELKKMDGFFSYANSKKCFRNNRLVDTRTINLGGINLGVCLVNTAPFSTLSYDDKEAHFLPSAAESFLHRAPDCDFMITIMHHSYEYFDSDSMEMLKKTLPENDLVLYGHEHISEGMTVTNDGGSKFNIIKGGRFDLYSDDNCAFNVMVLDDAEDSIVRYAFEWHKDSQLFVKAKPEMNISRYRSSEYPLEEYVRKLLADKNNLSEQFTDYYVLPKLVAAGGLFQEKTKDCIDIDSIFDAVSKAKIININGRRESGKTSLLKYLYAKSIEKGFFPLYLEQRDYHDSKIEKMFKGLYEDQYGEAPDGFESYMQRDFSKRIIFVDDIDMIKNEKARENLTDYIVSKGGLFIYSTKEPIRLDLIDEIKDRIRDEEQGTLEITPFYKEKRDELVESICKLPRVNHPEKSAEIISVFDYLVQCQASFFSLLPGALIPYIIFYANNGTDDKGAKSLTIVFETNIRRAMIESAKDKVNPYLAVLETLAYKMFFEKQLVKIPISEIEKTISEYNMARMGNVESKPFITACKNAGILIESEESYDIAFRDNNTYAYFVAKYINREIERNPQSLEHITYIMNHICFGINGTIVLFLSYIRSNTRIIIDIASKASELMSEYPELNFDENNIPFITRTTSKANFAPNEDDRKKATQVTEEVEKHRHDVVEFRSIFDFDEKDVDTEKYRVLRALCYVRLLGQMLVDQYGTLEAEDLKIMLNALYETPQKVLYAVLKPYQDHYDEIIDKLVEYVKRAAPDEHITRENLQNMLSAAASTLCLNVMNDIAYNSTNRNTIEVLNQGALTNSNRKIQNLMMCENAGDSDAFVDKAKVLYDEYSAPFIHYMIGRIAQKHLLYKPKIDQRIMDKLVSYKILSHKAKKATLIERQKEREIK